MNDALDAVLGDIQSLNVKLSKTDKDKLDEYATSLRALEGRLDNMGTGRACEKPAQPAASPPLNQDRGITPTTVVEQHTPLFVELMALAFTCDITRSLTFMLCNGTSNNDFQFLIGSSTPHHGTSHHNNEATKLAGASGSKGSFDAATAEELLKKIDDIAKIFWETKQA